MTARSGEPYTTSSKIIDPIAALLIGTRPSGHAAGDCHDAAKIIGVSMAWCGEFLSGFWNAEDPCGIEDEAWELGQMYRALFVARLIVN